MMNRIRTLIWVAGLALLWACNPMARQEKMQPPLASKIEQMLVMHGDTRIDFYYWLRDRNNPEVIAYLEAENAFTSHKMEHTAELQEQLFQEMMGRIKQDESTAPYFENGYYYYIRYEMGGEYPLYCRKKGTPDAPEEIILNVPQMASAHPYFRIGSFTITSDNNLLAFSVDTVGRRQHTILLKNLQTGQITHTGIEHAAGDVVWAADDKTLFFTTLNPETLRYDNVRKFNTENGGEPRIVYYEPDETYYYMDVSRTKDRKFIVINCRSSVSNEIRILESETPTGNFRIFEPRRPGHEYSIEHRNGQFYVLTNDRAQNFRVVKTAANRTQSSNWQEIIPHRSDVLVENIELFNNFLVLQERSNALAQMRVIDLMTGKAHYISFDEEAYSISINVNREMNTDVFRYGYTSLTTPFTIFDYNLTTREKTQIWQQTVLGGFNPSNYETRRKFVDSRDGVRIPITLVYRKDADNNQPKPLLQYGYGSYGNNSNPGFNSNIISLVDRGFIYVIAHIRGGQEMGRQWYEDGKFLNKINTFNDFIDVSEYLINNNYTTAEKLFASGGSAGGLLMGAVVNMRPELYRGIIAQVPFVDVVTTMLDETIPLTTAEYDEWGNPNDPVYYRYLLSYSPYDQVTSQAYPNMLITSGLHDSQVQFWEPTKWTAKLRQYNTSNNLILLQTNMEAGHGGASGRFRRLRELALQYTFIIDLL